MGCGKLITYHCVERSGHAKQETSVTRARNAVIIIALSIIGAYYVRERPGAVVHGVAAHLRDTVAGTPSRGGRALRTGAAGNGEELRDAVAGYPAIAPLPARTTDHHKVDLPLGSGEGGIEPLPYDPGRSFAPRVVSPSGPDTR